jgi:2'-5' RNA ligase
MKRTFIAIKTEAGEKIMDCISHGKTCLSGERMKWVNPAQLHFTLAFLGDTSPDQVAGTIQMLTRVVPAYDAPHVEYRGMGVFRNMKDPRVLWIGLDVDPVLMKLKVELDRELQQLGFRIERRDFRPHLTLARIKGIRDKASLRELLHAYREYHFQDSIIRQLVYYESILGRDGPVYKVINSAGFKYDAPSTG